MGIVLLAWIALLPPQQLEREFEQQRQELQQIRNQLQVQQQQLERLTELLEDSQDPAAIICTAAIRQLNGPGRESVGPGDAVSVSLNLFSTVSQPREECLPAEIRVTASYLDTAGKLICSGMVPGVAVQNSLTESIYLEIRPWNLREFIRWGNEPQTVRPASRLDCLVPDGLTQATTMELSQVASLQVYSTLLPSGGGVSTAEFWIDLVQ